MTVNYTAHHCERSCLWITMECVAPAAAAADRCVAYAVAGLKWRRLTATTRTTPLIANG